MFKTTKTPFAVVLCIVTGFAAGQTTVDLDAAKDNTLYQSATGTISNGAGQWMFSGLTNGFSVRRCVIEFDVAGAIPAGATIESAELTLLMSRSISDESSVALHRVSQEWGEGNSDAGGEEGSGTVAADGDVTWVHAIYDTGGASTFWASSGGDYDGQVSAAVDVWLPGFYTWSTPQLAADVQAWLDDDNANHGWMIITDEENPSAKRYNTREDPNPSNRPVLRVTYSMPADCPPDFTGEGDLDFFDVQAFLQAFAAMDQSADFVDDDVFNFFDVQAFLQAFAAGCP